MFLTFQCNLLVTQEKLVAHSLLKHEHLILFKECLLSNEFVGVVLEFANVSLGRLVAPDLR